MASTVWNKYPVCRTLCVLEGVLEMIRVVGLLLQQDGGQCRAWELS